MPVMSGTHGHPMVTPDLHSQSDSRVQLSRNIQRELRMRITRVQSPSQVRIVESGEEARLALMS